jgi:outer membrane lipoprotein SlyB
MSRAGRLAFAFVAALAALAALPAAAQTPGPALSPPGPALTPPAPAQAPAGPSPSGAPAPAAADDCGRCGKIESIIPVTAKDQWTPLGTVTSSAIGAGANGNPSAVMMHQIGPGLTNQGSVLIGAAGGAAYGSRPGELNRQRWEVTVRMDAGGTRSVMQNYEPMLREGDRVRVLGTQIELIQ